MLHPLLTAIAAFHRQAPHVPAQPMLSEVLEAIDNALAQPKITPIRGPRLPVETHLDAIDVEASSGVIGAVVREFLAVAPALPWHQTTGYLSVLSDHYLANYGYVRLIGPDSVVEHPSVRVGIGVWGPGLDYPMHEHEAEELYSVLYGEPEFRVEGQEFSRHGVGDAIHHAPWVRHAQRFGDTPTLLLYAWTGAVLADAVLVDTARPST